MKKLIALSTIALATSAFAQTTTTTTISKSALSRILENTSVSYYGSIEKASASEDNKENTLYNEITVKNKLTSDVAVFVRPRFEIKDGNADENGTGRAYWKNTRMGIQAFSFTQGNYTMSPELRLELNNVDGGDTQYAKARLSQNSKLKINNNLTATLWTGLYKNITKDEASVDAKDGLEMINVLTAAYEINDKHAFYVDYEIISNINTAAYRTDADAYENKRGDNTVYAKYSNSAIKNVVLIPGMYANTAKELNLENTTLTFEAVVKF